ncbi:glycosyltransferase family 2 protein [Hominifimenecus sp. rT4P-3]|uniref:glycosyltransferase family 2 protein n=1 Tax=Hominifimenecus sp. rT4P-3 TaxID=3242979 RepID=UPI003DA370B4
MEKISFVIPCYRSEHTIEDVVEEIRMVMGEDGGYHFEIILVNDNSPDGVWPVIQQLTERYDNIRGICLAKNFGQHSALMAGYANASGDIIVSLDDDGQSPVDEVFLLLDQIHNGYDVVYGYYPEIKQSKFRIFGSLVNEKMTEVLIGKPKGLKGTSFYAAKRFVIQEMLHYKNAYPYVGGLVFRSTNHVTSVPVHHRERKEGHSGYTLRKLLSLWMNGFTAFSAKPLRIATYLGFICSLIGFFYGIFIVIRRLLDSSIQAGYSSLMACIVFIGGIIMMLLGLIGEYVGRVYISINNAPQYVIRETAGFRVNESEKNN